MTPDPFWKRSGFYTALMATVPILFALFRGAVTPELVTAVIAAWGTFLTAKTIRPSNNTADVRALLEQQQDTIRDLRIVNDGGAP